MQKQPTNTFQMRVIDLALSAEGSTTCQCIIYKDEIQEITQLPKLSSAFASSVPLWMSLGLIPTTLIQGVAMDGSRETSLGQEKMDS